MKMSDHSPKETNDESELKLDALEAENTRLWARLGELTADTEGQKP